MSEPGIMVIGPDMGVKGQVRNCRRLEVKGAFEGEVSTEMLVVHPGGRCLGSVRADNVEVLGNLEGQIRVRNLILIRSSGAVAGNVQYGSMSLEPGGELSAEVRNVPPTIAGDFQLEVRRGGSAPVTLADLTALDPDDAPEDLRFSVVRTDGGTIQIGSAAASTFTQADLASGAVAFRHDGSSGSEASFAVVVTDAKGGTSGAPRAVKVAVG